MARLSEIYNENSEWNLYLFIASLPIAVSILLILFILIFFQFLPSKMPLFYSLPWGDLQLATHIQFFVVPISIILINLINLFMVWNLHPSQKFFKTILVLSTLVITFIFLTTFTKIFLIFA